ncbi:hypothetical protein B9057_12940 [Aestuarium zhoushanense]|nr:hypothetical protein B9057_12940 [Aestuarium zhoushanense]
MKKILLASVALTAFAGAAAAEVSFSGSATLGYNDTDATAAITARSGTATDDNDGFYWSATMSASLSQDLDNGIAVGAKVNFDIQDDNGNATNGNTNLNADDYVLSLTSENASIYFGDTGVAGSKYWAAAGDMESDGFTSDYTDAANADAVLRADINYGGVELSASTIVVQSDQTNSVQEQTSASLRTTLGGVTITAATQEKANTTVLGAAAGDYNANAVWGVSAAMAVAGADVTVAYAEEDTGANGTNSSTGIKVAYPVGDVTVTAYYVDENPSAANLSGHNGDENYGIAVAYAAGDVAVTLDYQDDQSVTKTSLDVTYDMGNGLSLLAGMYDEDGNATAADDGTDSYVAASYSLGGGASLLVAYANADTKGAIKADEVGTPDYQDGTTIELSFAF